MGDSSAREGETPPAPISAPISKTFFSCALGSEPNRALNCAITSAVGAAPCAYSVGVAGAAAAAALECTLEVSSGLECPLSARRPANRLK